MTSSNDLGELIGHVFIEYRVAAVRREWIHRAGHRFSIARLCQEGIIGGIFIHFCVTGDDLILCLLSSCVHAFTHLPSNLRQLIQLFSIDSFNDIQRLWRISLLTKILTPLQLTILLTSYLLQLLHPLPLPPPPTFAILSS